MGATPEKKKMTRRLAAIGVATAALGLIRCGCGPGENSDKKEPTFFYYDLEQVTVSLTHNKYTKYLQVVFTLQTDLGDKDQVEELLGRKWPELRHRIIFYLSALPDDKLTGEENLKRIRKDVGAMANEQLGSDMVKKVLLTKFVMQS